MLLDREDTIAAICSPPGRGGCAILRLSGSGAFSILDAVVASVPSGTFPADDPAGTPAARSADALGTSPATTANVSEDPFRADITTRAPCIPTSTITDTPALPHTDPLEIPEKAPPPASPHADGDASASTAQGMPGGSPGNGRRFATPGRMTLDLRPTPETQRRCTCPVFVYRMPAPRSYTREDVAEIHMPGSPPLQHAAMRALVEAGARVAQPGEFTLRAFLRGRLDLGQVEGLGRLIAAQTEAERREALGRMDRRLGKRIAAIRASLLEVLAELEAHIDFEEEESGTLPPGFMQHLDQARDTCATLAAGADLERRCAARVRILGLTNAGKSALLNALLGREAALVSAQPTTTRDILRHDVRVGHATLTLEDSPGLDPSGSEIGTRAGAHTVASLASVSHGVLVVDGSTAPDSRLRSLLQALPPSRLILVRSKADCPRPEAGGEGWMETVSGWVREAGHTDVAHVDTSVVTGEGLAALRTVLEAEALGDAAVESASHCSVREAAELREAGAAVEAAREALAAGWGQEFVAEDIRHAVEALHRAEGGGYADAVLDSIFSRFCIGK